MPRRFRKTCAGLAGMRAMRRFASVTSGESRSPASWSRFTRRSMRARVSSQMTSSRPRAAAAERLGHLRIGKLAPDLLDDLAGAVTDDGDALDRMAEQAEPLGEP